MGDPLHIVHVDTFTLSVDPIGNEIKKLPGKIDRTAMGQMPTMGKIHTEHLVAWFKRGEIDCHICLAAGMRLDIGVFGAKEFLGPVDGEILHRIGILTTTIITLGRIAFGIFVGEN